MRRGRLRLSVSKLGGGNYRSAPRSISGMLCVGCILDMLPNAVRRPVGYSGAGRWDSRHLRSSARDLYVPTTEAEAHTASRAIRA